jgi:hypothetical protein
MDYSQINYKGIQSEIWEKWTLKCNDLCQMMVNAYVGDADSTCEFVTCSISQH